jgi:hypothetical protein
MLTITRRYTVFQLAALLFLAGVADASAAEPATPEAAAKVLDLRTFPRMKGAGEASLATLGILLYEAPVDTAAAYEFQKQALAKAGWKELPGAFHTDENHAAEFKHGDYTLSVGVNAVMGDPKKQGWSQISLVNHGNVTPTSLPAPKGVKPFGSLGGQAMYLGEATVADTAAAASKLMTGAGWVPYGAAGTEEMPMLYFKKNGIRVMAWISKAPAQDNKTMLRYSTELLSADLPFPPDVPTARYDDADKSVSFDYQGEEIDPLVQFYQQELAKRGWKATTDRPVTDDRERTAFLVFRNATGDLISLDMQHFNDIVRTKVEFDTAAEVKEEECLAKEAAKKKLAEEKAAELVENEKPAASGPGEEMPELPTGEDVDALLKSAEKMAADAIGAAQDAVKSATGKTKPDTKPQTRPATGSTAVADLAMPEGAGVEYSKITKMIKVTSPDDVGTLARFFQEQLPEQGWTAEPNPLVTDDSAILKFSQGGATLTIMADGEQGGSEATLMTKGLNWDRTPASRAATKVAGKKPVANDAPAEMPDEPAGDEPQPEAKPDRLRYAAEIPAAQQKVAGASIVADGKTYQLGYGVAYQAIEDGGDLKTEVLLSTKPINVAKIVALLNNGQDGGDALSFDPQLKLRYDAAGKLSYLFMYASGLSVNLGGQGEDKIQASLTVDGDRARGQAKLVEPGKLFDQQYTFTAPFDVRLIRGKPATETEAGAPAPAAEELGAEEHDGIPYPLVTKNRSSSGSQFRQTAEATIPAPLPAVVEFYRRELAARGWKEDPKAAKVTDEAATLAFASPEGTMSVTLARNAENTQATLAARYPAKAKAAGVAPQDNKGRLILGNAGDKEVTIVINGQPYKVAAGRGAKNPKDGVSLHVLPGNYTFSIKAGGKGEPGEKLKIAIGETWGIIVLPTGGYFADQVY